MEPSIPTGGFEHPQYILDCARKVKCLSTKDNQHILNWNDLAFAAVNESWPEVLEACLRTDTYDAFKTTEGESLLAMYTSSKARLSFRVIEILLRTSSVTQSGDNLCKILFEVMQREEDGKENWNIVKALFEAGATTGYRDSMDDTCLHVYVHALKFNFDEEYWSLIIDLLLAKGCDINAWDLRRATPLSFFLMVDIPHSHYTGQGEPSVENTQISNDHALKIVQKLISCGAEVNCQNLYGENMLYNAAQAMNLEICQALIDAGANGNINSMVGGNVLSVMANNFDGLPEVPLTLFIRLVDMLINKGKVDINMSCLDGSRIIHQAASSCAMSLVDVFINFGADFHAVDSKRRNVLHYAASNNDMSVLTYFLIRKVDVNARDVNLYTPLHVACLRGNVGAIRVLVQSGADIEAKANLQISPLHLCCGVELSETGEENNEGLIGSIRALVEAGVCINDTDAYGSTVLHHNAFTNESESAICALLELGADRHMRDSNEKTPLDVSLFQANYKIAQVLGHSRADLAMSPPGDQCVTIEEFDWYTNVIKSKIKQLRKKYHIVALKELQDIGLHITDSKSEANQFVRQQVEKFVLDIVKELGNLDNRFEGRLICSGSMYEEVRIGKPDEFDYMVDLIRFSSLVTGATQSKDPGFLEVQVVKDFPPNMKSFLSPQGEINGMEFLREFKELIRQAISRVHSKGHMHIYESERELWESTPDMNLLPGRNILSNTHIRWSCGTYKNMLIDLDINPVVFVDTWPVQCQRTSALVENIDKSGVYLIPKELDVDENEAARKIYLWRVSFSHIETKICRSLPDNVLNAFRLIKALREKPITPNVTDNPEHQRQDVECTSGSSSGHESSLDGESATGSEIGDDQQLVFYKHVEPKNVIKTFYLKQLFLKEIDKLSRTKKTWDGNYELLITKRVYQALRDAIDATTLCTYLVPSQNVFHYNPDTGAYGYQAQKKICQHIIDVIDAMTKD